MTASLSGAVVEPRFQTYRPHEAFAVGPFTITPYLTDHSAFDAHMLLVEIGGKRILYSGDFVALCQHVPGRASSSRGPRRPSTAP